MTYNAAPAGADAQPSAVANSTDDSVEAILNSSQTEELKPEGEEPAEKPILSPEEELTKLRKALDRKNTRIGQLTAQKHQALEENQKLLSKLQSGTATATQEKQAVADNKGVPTKLNQNDFKNYADYIEARAAEIAEYHIDRKLSERDGKNEKAQSEQKVQTWENERVPAVDKMAADFAKEHPDVEAMFEEYSDTIRDFPKELKHALLSADNPPLAFYNLAKDGKLEELASMPLIDARVEIRLAQMKEAAKPKTKAPIPLPATRGSVPGTKPYDKYSAREAHKLLSNIKD